MIRTLACATLALSLSTTAYSKLLQFSFVDGTADQTRETGADLLSVTVVFDNATGTYTTTLHSTAAAPFSGKISINANFADVDTPAYVLRQSYFFDNLRTLELSEPSTTASWSGIYSSLRYWKEGDRVVTSSDLFGIVPDAGAHSFGSNFTSYLDFPYTSTDEISRLSVATISSVPEPSQSVFMLLGLGLIITAIRKEKEVIKA